MKNYGLARKISVCDLSSGEETEFIATPAAYLQAKLWCGKHLKGVDEDTVGVYENYAWMYHGAKLAGKADELGLPSELTREGIEELSGRLTFYLDNVQEEDIPLATKGGASKKK